MDLLRFGCENSNEGDYLLFDKNKCSSELSETWGKNFEVFLNDLNGNPGSGVEVIEIGAVADKKKIHLIKNKSQIKTFTVILHCFDSCSIIFNIILEMMGCRNWMLYLKDCQNL